MFKVAIMQIPKLKFTLHRDDISKHGAFLTHLLKHLSKKRKEKRAALKTVVGYACLLGGNFLVYIWKHQSVLSSRATLPRDIPSSI